MLSALKYMRLFVLRETNQQVEGQPTLIKRCNIIGSQKAPRKHQVFALEKNILENIKYELNVVFTKLRSCLNRCRLAAPALHVVAY